MITSISNKEKLRILAIFIAVCICITPAFSNIDVLSLTPQQSVNGKWGYVDDNGSYKIRPKYESALPFKEDLAVISIFKKFGFIDAKGRFVVHPQFDDARSFSENLAAVMIYDQNASRKWGFIDKSGKFVISPQYDEVSDFSGFSAQVKVNGKAFTIDKSGKEIDEKTIGEKLTEEKIIDKVLQ